MEGAEAEGRGRKGSRGRRVGTAGAGKHTGGSGIDAAEGRGKGKNEEKEVVAVVGYESGVLSGVGKARTASFDREEDRRKKRSRAEDFGSDYREIAVAADTATDAAASLLRLLLPVAPAAAAPPTLPRSHSLPAPPAAHMPDSHYSPSSYPSHPRPRPPRIAPHSRC